MIAKIKTIAAVCVVVLAVGQAWHGVALASRLASATPVIKDFSSKGGTPQHKAGDRDLIYLAKLGDEITFSIATDKPCEHVWSVRQGAKVLTSQTKQGVKQSTFTWQVPQAKAAWNIEVVAYDYKAPVGPIAKAQKAWSVTTCAIKTVKPGQSIQKAIEALPPEGGIVELAAGTHYLQQTGTIDVTLHKNQKGKIVTTKIGPHHYTGKVTYKYAILLNERKNVTVRGAGRDKTVLINKDKGYPKYDIIFIVKGSSIAISDMFIRANATSGFIPITTGRAIRIMRKCADIDISNVRAERLYKGVSANGLHVQLLKEYHAIENLVIRDSLFSWLKNPITFRTTYHSTITNCEISHGFSGYGINLNAACDDNIMEKNKIHHIVNSGINTYAGNDRNVIRDNICYECEHGIKPMTGAKHIDVINNTCRNNRRDGISLTSFMLEIDHIRVLNNRVYNNKRHGIGIFFFNAVRLDHKPPYDIIIDSNTIFANGADGIAQNVYNYKIEVKNNIITRNIGYGINHIRFSPEAMKECRQRQRPNFRDIIAESEYILSNNNVWGNGKGNYKDVSAGTGDMSADPLFADPANGDFHLKSKAGRWDSKTNKWIKDKVHSPCIDAGDPKSEYKNEPGPNGGRGNMGAYGNTDEASKSAN